MFCIVYVCVFKSNKGDIKSVLIEPKEIAEMAEFGKDLIT